MKRKPTDRFVLPIALITVFGGLSASAQDLQGLDESAEYGEHRWLVEKLKTAKSAPTLPGVNYRQDARLSSQVSSQQRNVVGVDLETGELTLAPASAVQADKIGSSPPSPGAGLPTRADSPTSSSELEQPQAAVAEDAAPSAAAEATLDGGLSPSAIVATQPQLLLDTVDAPFNTVHKMLMEFYSSDDDEFYYYVCSGWSTGSFHIATAGHCIYNWDPNGDGVNSDASWATTVWTWAAQTDRVDPFGVGDFPYGVSQSTFLRAPEEWTASMDYDHDWGLVTLDRRQGDWTGSMGREAGVEVASLNFTGYPVEAPFVPSKTLGQYVGFDENNVIAYTTNRIQLDAFMYGGHDGGPSWRYDGANAIVQGIHSTFDPTDPTVTENTRLTADILAAIDAAMSEDETTRAPTAKPNLIEYWFDISAKVLLTGAVPPGGELTVEYNAYNAGFASADNTRLDFYLSINPVISSSDTFIGSVDVGTLGAGEFTNLTTSLTVPASVAEDSYYLGWIMSTSTPEYNTDDNAVVITDPLLTITTAGPRFVDVPFDYWAWAYIEAIADAGITNGCATDRFCPSDSVPRDQMAAFIVRALEGEPAADYCGTEAPFLDVPADYWACKYIKRLAELGITIGCDLSGDLYCPSNLVPRDQMAVFLVRAIEGDPAPGYCAGVSPFDDVPVDYWACGHIKRLFELGVTTGCGDGDYCPSDIVPRDQMATFLARAFLGVN